MNKDISNLLKEATQDLLSEETLKAISEAVETKAEEKVQLAVEAALVQQDEEYAKKLEAVLEAIDTDHTQKLDKLFARIDENHAAKFNHALESIDESHSKKLETLVELYETALHAEAEKFKNTLVEQLSNYIDLYIDKAIPAKQISEATENTRSLHMLNEIKRLIGISDVFVNENIKEALIDGKQQIDEANARANKLAKEVKLITEQKENFEKSLFLEKNLENFPASKKEYMIRVLSEKTLSSIKENFNYVSELYDKKESEDAELLKETTVPMTEGVDVVADSSEELVNESKSYSSAEDTGSDYVMSNYVSEFRKKY